MSPWTYVAMRADAALEAVVARLKGEPVLTAGAVSAVTTMGFAVGAHNLSEGIVVSAVLAVISLVTRSKVTPS